MKNPDFFPCGQIQVYLLGLQSFVGKVNSWNILIVKYDYTMDSLIELGQRFTFFCQRERTNPIDFYKARHRCKSVALWHLKW